LLCAGGGFPPKPAPCNATIGYENVYESFGKFMGKGCKRSIFQPFPSAMDCYRANVFVRLV